MEPVGQGGRGVGTAIDRAARFAREDPLLAAGAVVAALVVLVLVAVIIRRLRRTKGGIFVRKLATPDELAILMHPNPDPDAMACALGVAELAESVETAATIYYPGQIRHQENRAFETVLDLDFTRVESESEILPETVVLVDHNEPRGFPGAEAIDPYAVVDHHPGGGTGQAFTDVRPEYGSCASIISEYFRQLGWQPRGPDEQHNGGQLTIPSSVSTGLLYGIQSDTKHLTKGCSEAEFVASAYLYQGIDEDRLDRIANPQVDAEVLDVKARAITEREVRNAFAVSDVGEVSNADAIPQAADELLRLEGVTAVIVMGRKDDTIHLSGRSRDDRVHMGNTLRAAVEDIPQADAGGHARMGGGQVAVDRGTSMGATQAINRETLTNTLFDAMSGNV